MVKLIASRREAETNKHNYLKPGKQYATSKRPGSGGPRIIALPWKMALTVLLTRSLWEKEGALM